ncbi:MAG: alginate export family protein [Bryobacteraceae bacterium]
MAYASLFRIPGGRCLLIAGAALLLTAGGRQLFAQQGKVAAPGSDSSRTPIGGPAGSPLSSAEPFDAPELKPVGQLNDQLPKWIQFGLDERFRFESYSGNGFKPGVDDSYLLNRFRFGVIIQPSTWFKVVGQVQDGRPFLQKPPYGPPNKVAWDLKLAYAEFGDPETQPITFRVGRQLLDYNNTILSNSEWRNQARSYDAVVTNIHVKDFRLGLFAASVVNPLVQGISHHQEGNNIYGAYGNIGKVIPKSSIEPFVLWRVAPSVAIETTATKKTGHLDEKAYGFRIAGKDISHFDYRAEFVREGGSAGPNNIKSWATTLGAGYTVSSIGWRPRLFAGYDYATGDKDPKDGTHGAFDTMYPSAHDRFGITDQFGWQNIKAGRGGVTIVPHRHWTVTGQYLDFWLASATDSLYNGSGGSILRDSTGKSGKHVGEEVDFYTWYEINKEVHVGAGIGHILPGEFLAKAGKGASYTYPYFVIEMFDGKRVR